MTGVLIDGAFGDRHAQWEVNIKRHRGEGAIYTETEDGNRSSRGASLVEALILDLWPQSGKNDMLLSLKPAVLWYFLTSALVDYSECLALF